MRKVISMCVMFLCALPCLAQDIAPSKIVEVTIFNNQALITRDATVQIEKGLQTIRLGVDAFGIDPDSVRAKVVGTGEVYSVQSKTLYLNDAPQGNIAVLEKAIEEIKDERSSLQNQKHIIAQQEEFLTSLIDFAKTQVPREIKTEFPTVADLDGTLAFIKKSFRELTKEKEDIAQKTKELAKNLRVKEQELAALKGSQKKERQTIEVLFLSQKAQSIRVQANYIAYRASWHPLYKVTVPASLDTAKLTMFSTIMQKTGEDWDGVQLTVSNVIPLRGATLPQASSWVLDILRPVQRSTKGIMEEAAFVQARRTKLPLAFEYVLPQGLTIPSQEGETILPLFSKTLKGSFHYHAVPQLSPLTFLTCTIAPDAELLPGSLQVYFADRFLGTTQLTEKKPGEKFSLNLGADREVIVKRETIKDKLRETFFKKIDRQTLIREMAFKITVENAKSKPIEIDIFDTVPVSRTDRIEVKNLTMTPRPTKENYQDKEGVYLWKLKLKPKEKKEITLTFVVTYPNKTPIKGL